MTDTIKQKKKMKKFEDSSFKIIVKEIKRNKRIKRVKKVFRNYKGNIKRSNICILGGPPPKKQNIKLERNYFKEIMAENFPNLGGREWISKLIKSKRFHMESKITL